MCGSIISSFETNIRMQCEGLQRAIAKPFARLRRGETFCCIYEYDLRKSKILPDLLAQPALGAVDQTADVGAVAQDAQRSQKHGPEDDKQVASHAVIDQAVARFGRDYRFETAPHPVHELRSRTQDNTAVGCDPSIPGYNQITPEKA